MRSQDMNWRNVSDGQDQYYTHPNTALFPNLTHWFGWLHNRSLRTYLNDHPYPVAARGAGGLQTSPAEIGFRTAGLRDWMDRGVDFWWFDRCLCPRLACMLRLWPCLRAGTPGNDVHSADATFAARPRERPSSATCSPRSKCATATFVPA